MNYVLTITYNFDVAYVCKPFNTKEEAISELNRMLQRELSTVVNESEYEPTVIRNSEDDISLIYEPTAKLFDNNGERTGFDTAVYKVMEIEK